MFEPPVFFIEPPTRITYMYYLEVPYLRNDTPGMYGAIFDGQNNAR